MVVVSLSLRISRVQHAVVVEERSLKRRGCQVSYTAIHSAVSPQWRNWGWGGGGETSCGKGTLLPSYHGRPVTHEFTFSRHCKSKPHVGCALLCPCALPVSTSYYGGCLHHAGWETRIAHYVNYYCRVCHLTTCSIKLIVHHS